MKRMMLVLALILGLSGCGSSQNIQIRSDCSRLSVEDATKKIIQVMVENGLIIRYKDEATGVIHAESVTTHDIWTGYNLNISWNIFNNNGNIVAQAFLNIGVTNAFGANRGGSQITMNDAAAESYTAYWVVRNKIQEVCGNIQFVDLVKVEKDKKKGK